VGRKGTLYEIAGNKELGKEEYGEEVGK